MGTIMESAYIERLHEDIKIACAHLEEQGIETFVLAVTGDNHCLLGSQKGQIFLEEKISLIAEFVKFCNDKRQPTATEKQTASTLNDPGRSVQLHESVLLHESVQLQQPTLLQPSVQLHQSVAPVNIHSLETPTLHDVESILNTPALHAATSVDFQAGSSSETLGHSSMNAPSVLNNGSSFHKPKDDNNGYTEVLATDNVDLQDDVPNTNLDIKDSLSYESHSSSPKKKKTKADNTSRDYEASPRRILRSGKSVQASDIVENLPRVKTVLSKLKTAELTKHAKDKVKTREMYRKVIDKRANGTASTSTRTMSSKERAEAICKKAFSNAKSRTDSVKEIEKKVETPKSRIMKYLCHLCRETFDTAEELQAHVQVHKSLACHLCKKIFKTKESAEEHINVHKEANEYNECEKCDKVFKFPWQFDEHVETTHENPVEEDGEYPCSRCGHVFRKMINLNEHNEKNTSCADNKINVQTKTNIEDALLSEIEFTDSSGLPKKVTVKELIENVKMPATCVICQKTTDKLYNYKRHILHHSKVKPHKCVTCGQRFQIEDNLKKHNRLHELRPYYCSNENCYRRFETKTRMVYHSRFSCKKTVDKPDLVCQECGHKSSTVYAMESHQRTHTGIKAYSCEICGKHLATKESIERHKLVFHQDERPWECGQCGKRFKIRDTLRKHEKTHGEKKFRCEICDKLWVDSSDLKKHMRTHAEAREKNYICDQCGEKFHRKSYLVTHRYKHTGELPFKCDIEICGKGCVESGNLKKHMQTHTKEKPFICDICGKTYGRRSLLDNHYRLHTGELPYKCDFKGCDKAFRSYGNLKQHKANHVQDHSFICDICGKTFKLKSRMNHHRKSHIIEHRWPCDYCEMKFKSIFMYKNHLAKIHPLMKKDIEERTNIRLYQCEICQKMYGDKEDLTRHIYIHNGLKPFKCSYCGKGFNDKSNMKCHERIHTGEKKLNCRFCYKTFLQPRALRQHLKNVHGKDEEEQDEKHEVLPRTKEENSYRVENVNKSEGFSVDQECQAAVENVLNVESGPSLLLDMRTVSQAVITEPSHAALVQTYPTHTLEQPAHLFPQLVKEFEPLMIVENY